jgi:hypothetical protein
MLFATLAKAVPVTVKSLNISQSTSKIQIDGVLDEPSWQIAEQAVNFHQRFPADSSLASTITEVRMTYDDEFLYIGATCYDKTEGKYVVESLRRDFESRGNDAFNIVIDPHSDLINGFLFGITPFGVQRESLIINGGGGRSDENTSWDNVWFSEVSTHKDHWVVEIAIPFNTLRYEEGVDKWRINFVRVNYKDNEHSNWNWVPRTFSSTSLAHTGELQWDKPLKENRRNLALIPYASAGVGKDYEGTDPARFIRGIGTDAKIGLTSSLNLDLTVNPDFSQVEVDQQVTNLDRFEIFFPEKRQFFLENSDIFDEFGYQSSSPNNVGGNAIRPFFSRRIGIAVDTATGLNVENPIYLGARMSGRVNEDWRMGIMSMQASDDKDFGLPSINYSVAAVQRRVFSRSNLAAIFVNKDPVSFLSNDADSTQLNSFNRVAGVDYNLASLDNRWLGKIFYHQSFGPEKLSSPFAHGAILNYTDENWTLRWNHAIVGEGYNAEVGYVRRTGYKRISPRIDYDFYPASKILNRHGPSVTYESIWDMNGGKLDEKIGFRYMFILNNQMFGYVSLNRDYILLTQDYDPTRTDGPELLDGTGYHNNYLRYYFRSDIRKALSFDVRGLIGEYYNGSRFEAGGDMNYRFRPYGVLSVKINYNRIRLPQPYHSADLYLIGPMLDLTFSRNVYFATLVQYNSQINNVNVNARFQWRYKPSSDIYLVYTDNYFADVFKSKNRALVFKITYWLNI